MAGGRVGRRSGDGRLLRQRRRPGRPGGPQPPSRARARTCAGVPADRGPGALPARAQAFSRVERRPTGVAATVGTFTVTASLAPLRISAAVKGKPVVEEVPAGLSLDGARVTSARLVQADACGVRLAVVFDGGRTATMSLQATGDATVAVTLRPDDGRLAAKWGDRLVSSGRRADLRAHRTHRRRPQRVGDHARRRSVRSTARARSVTMSVRPTIAAYAPFYQSSKGYGLLVDGTMPGAYDIAKTMPRQLSFDYEMDPTARAARWFLFGGPGHYAINDGVLASRGPSADPPPQVVSCHTRGRDVLPPGPPVDGRRRADEPDRGRRHPELRALRHPAGHLPLRSSVGRGHRGLRPLCSSTAARFPDPDGMLRVMRARGWRIQVWFSEWQLDERGARAASQRLARPGQSNGSSTSPTPTRWRR